jgi:hypothetical protein
MKTSTRAISALLLLASCSPRDRYIKRSVTPAEVVGEWEPSQAVVTWTPSSKEEDTFVGLQRLVLRSKGSCRVLTPATRDGDDAPWRNPLDAIPGRVSPSSPQPFCWWTLGTTRYVPVDSMPLEAIRVPAVLLRITNGGWDSGDVVFYLGEKADTLVLWHKAKDAYYRDAVVLVKRKQSQQSQKN